jgi:type VII secretion-associated serine protease mycosin
MPAKAAASDGVRDDQWYLESLKVVAAHKLSQGDGIVVGVVDTGVFPHIDLKKNLIPGVDISAGGDGKGTTDQDGHGTRMAGLIAAHGRSGNQGLLGIAPNAKILPIKTVAKENGGTFTIALGIERAISAGADVVNVSAATGPSIELEDAITRAADKDVVVVAGSGNTTTMVRFGYPAASPGVLAVGAVDSAGKHAEISITGEKVEICAPGIRIESTQPGNKYVFSDGTSASTAIVSGAAALVRAKFPNLTAQQVINRLTATATDIGPPGRDKECGFGSLNIVKALTADVPGEDGPAAQPSSSQTPTATQSGIAGPDTNPSSSNVLAIAGGFGGVLLAGGLVAFLLARRRRRS